MQDTAHDIMSKKLVTVRMTDSVRTAYEIMQERKIRHLPVVDAMGEIIGILSDRDLQRAMKPKKSPDFDEIEFNKTHTTQDYMSWPARSVPEDIEIAALTQLMLNEKMSALLVKAVGSHNRVRGIVTTDDLLKLLLQLLEKDPSRAKASLGSVFQSVGEGYFI